jgi:hypothetical protein
MVAAQVHSEPTHNDWHGAVRAGGDHEKGTVFHVPVMVDVHENRKAGDGDADVEHGEEESVADFV